MFFRRGRRRQIVVDKRFQYRYAFAGVLYIACIAICLSLPFTPLINTLGALLEGEPDYLRDLVQRQTRFAILTFVLCSLWLASAWALFAIRRSHRIAGPAYKLTTFMNGISRNNLGDRCSLRTGDELQAVSEALNGMLDRIQGHATPPRDTGNEPSEKQEIPEELLPR